MFDWVLIGSCGLLTIASWLLAAVVWSDASYWRKRFEIAQQLYEQEWFKCLLYEGQLKKHNVPIDLKSASLSNGFRK